MSLSYAARKAGWDLPQGTVDAFDREMRRCAPGGRLPAQSLPKLEGMPDMVISHLCSRLGAWCTAALQLADRRAGFAGASAATPLELWSATYKAGCELHNEWQYPESERKYLREDEMNAPNRLPSQYGFTPEWDRQAQREVRSDRLMLGLAIQVLDRAQTAVYYMCPEGVTYREHGGNESAGQCAAEAHAFLNQMLGSQDTAVADAVSELNMLRAVINKATAQ